MLENDTDDVKDVTDFLLANGFHQITEEEQKKEDFARESRSILRIPANDDRSIPAPNEDEELRAMGIEPPVD
jgi:ribosome maturation protein Sdo1